MKEFGEILSGAVLIGCVFGLLAIFVGVVIAHGVEAWSIWRRKRNVVVMTALACLALVVGGTKNMRSVNFPRTDMEAAYLIDNGSWVSNDFVHVSFNTFLIPQSAPIVLAYWPDGSTNEDEFVEFLTSPLSDWPRPLDFEFENAISNRWYCYTTWTPGPAAHTNGVFQQTWMTDAAEHIFIIPIRTVITEDGEQVAPPKFAPASQQEEEEP